MMKIRKQVSPFYKNIEELEKPLGRAGGVIGESRRGHWGDSFLYTTSNDTDIYSNYDYALGLSILYTCSRQNWLTLIIPCVSHLANTYTVLNDTIALVQALLYHYTCTCMHVHA